MRQLCAPPRPLTDCRRVQGADANARNKSRNIALHYHKGRVDVIEALLPRTKAIDTKVRHAAVATLVLVHHVRVRSQGCSMVCWSGQARGHAAVSSSVAGPAGGGGSTVGGWGKPEREGQVW